LEKEHFPINTSLFDPKMIRRSQSLVSSRTAPSVTAKVTDLNLSMSNSSILSQSGQKSLEKKELDQSPYFPHKYRDYDREYPNKWTGERDWKG
jgi:hypothetical protein